MVINGQLTLNDDQSVLQMNTDTNDFGSVVVLKNTKTTPQFLGAINFEHSSGTPGQIAYWNNHQIRSTFMTLNASGSGDHITMSNGAALTSGHVDG